MCFIGWKTVLCSDSFIILFQVWEEWIGTKKIKKKKRKLSKQTIGGNF